MRTTPESHTEIPLETRIATVGRDLARSFAGVLAAIPGSPHRPLSLARSLGLNKVLTSRILNATQQDDPFAVAHRIPGPEPLRRLLQAARKKRVSPRLIDEASVAVDRFEQLITDDAGDRSALDAIIGGWLPDVREQVDMIAKQSVYRGTSHLLGMACDVSHFIYVLYPSDLTSKSSQGQRTAERADLIWINITRGLRRVRPGQIINYDTLHTTVPVFTIAGKPVEGLEGLMLKQFCSRPLPRMEVRRLPDRVQYTLSGKSVGKRSAVNLVHATLMLAHKQISRGPNDVHSETLFSAGIGMPIKTFVYDLLLHEDIFRDQRPLLKMLRGTVGDGPPRPNDAGHDLNRIAASESIQALGQGVERMRLADTPNYQEILRAVCMERGWDEDKLRGFRCRIEYPMYSSQVVMSFELPRRSTRLIAESMSNP